MTGDSKRHFRLFDGTSSPFAMTKKTNSQLLPYGCISNFRIPSLRGTKQSKIFYMLFILHALVCTVKNLFQIVLSLFMMLSFIVNLSIHTVILFFFFGSLLFQHFAGACVQRPGGFAKWRLPQMFLRGNNVQFRTKLSAGLLPPLRQTAR